MRISSILALVITLALAAYSQANDDLMKKKAMKDTQETMNDRKKVLEITNSDPKAKAVDDSVNQLTGSEETSKEIYALSAEILPVLMEMNGDDPAKAMESLASYSKDPAAFMQKLPANIRTKIEAVAKKIERSKVQKKP